MAARSRAAQPEAAPPRPPATTEEVATFLRRKPHTLECWRSKGKGPQWRKLDGGGVVYDWDDVYAWYRSQPVHGSSGRTAEAAA